jgi:DNA-3-methyladenine glycosylase I
LMKNEGIVRNRMKIEATIANAKATLNVQDELGTLSSLIWSFTPTKPKKAPRTLADVPATSPESVAMSKELLKRGFKFVGPTTMYAAMQSLGLVNDHLATCFVRSHAKT